MQQKDLFSSVAFDRSKELDEENGLGPFNIVSDTVARKFDCSNYSTCLSYAANRRWKSFSCEGCRKTTGCRVTELTP